MDTAVANQLTLFNKGEAIDAERKAVMNRGAFDLAQLHTNALDYTRALVDSVKTGNRTGEAGDIVKSLKNGDDKVLDIPENFGIVGQLTNTEAIAKNKVNDEEEKKKAEAEAELKKRLLSPETANLFPGAKPINPISNDAFTKYYDESRRAKARSKYDEEADLERIRSIQDTKESNERKGKSTDLTKLLRQKGVLK